MNNFIDTNNDRKYVMATINRLSESDSFIVSLIDIIGRINTEEKIRYICYHDDLTDIYKFKNYNKYLIMYPVVDSFAPAAFLLISLFSPDYLVHNEVFQLY